MAAIATGEHQRSLRGSLSQNVISRNLKKIVSDTRKFLNDQGRSSKTYSSLIGLSHLCEKCDWSRISLKTKLKSRDLSFSGTPGLSNGNDEGDVTVTY